MGMMASVKACLLSLAGIDPAVLARCSTSERIKYSTIASTMYLVLPIEVMASCGHLLWLADLSLQVAASVTIAILVVAFVGERAAIVSMAGGRLSISVWMRFLLVFGIAFLATASFLLHLFERQLAQTRQVEKSSYERKLEADTSERLQLPKLRNDLVDAREAHDAAVRALAKMPADVQQLIKETATCQAALSQVRMSVAKKRAPVLANWNAVNAQIKQIRQPDFRQNALYEQLARTQSVLKSQHWVLGEPERIKSADCKRRELAAQAAKAQYMERAHEQVNLARISLDGEMQRFQAADQAFAKARQEITTTAEYANDESVQSQIKALMMLLRTDQIARAFALGIYVLLVLISGMAVWLKLSGRGGLYDRIVLRDEAHAEADQRAELQLQSTRSDARRQQQLMMAEQVDVTTTHQHLASVTVAESARLQIEVFEKAERMIARSRLPRAQRRDYLSMLRKATATDQAVTAQWLIGRYHATGQQLPENWQREIGSSAMRSACDRNRTENQASFPFDDEIDDALSSVV